MSSLTFPFQTNPDRVGLTFRAVYSVLVPLITYTSLALYCVSLAWLLIRRVLTITGQRTMGVIRTRVFIYCVLCFLPNLYFILFLGQAIGFLLSYMVYALFRVSTNALLLLAMSSLARQSLPGYARCGFSVGKSGGDAGYISSSVKAAWPPYNAEAAQRGVSSVHGASGATEREGWLEDDGERKEF